MRRSGFLSISGISILALAFFTACHSARVVADPGSIPSSAGSRTRLPDNYISKQPPGTEHRPLKRRELRKKYATLLKTSPGRISNYRLYSFIDSWCGVRYRSGGLDKSGIDCSGLASVLFREVYGVTLERTVFLQHEESRNFKRKRKFREGDLVFFRISRSDPSHVGVYLVNGYFVHASTSKGVMIDNLNELYWQKAYAGGGKVKK